MKNRILFITLAFSFFLGFVSSNLFADNSTSTLSNPTAEDVANTVRGMAPDRPDTTESAITVPLGYYQIEMDLARFGHGNAEGAWQKGGNYYNNLDILPMNLKMGMNKRVDFQVIINPYGLNWDRASDGSVTRTDGFGGLIARLKINILGNDGNSKFSVGIMPWSNIPGSAGGDFEREGEWWKGGLIVMGGYDFSDRTGIGFMAEFDFERDHERGKYDFTMIQSAVISHNFVAGFSGYAEYINQVAVQLGTKVLPTLSGTAAVGATYQFNKNFIVDAGVNIGLFGQVDTVNPFLGFSARY